MVVYVPEDGMKTLMDAVDQVTSQTVNRDAIDSIYESTIVAPLPIHKESVPIIVGSIPFAHLGGSLLKRKHSSMTTHKGGPAAVSNELTNAHGDDNTRLRAKRLEQNRLAAIDTRRRKKHMVIELHRSVTYYSKANTTLKSQNYELECQLLLAKQNINASRGEQFHVSVSDKSGLREATAPKKERTLPVPESKPNLSVSAVSHDSSAYSALLGNISKAEMKNQAQRAQFVATQALYKSLGQPAGANVKPSTIRCLSTLLWKDSFVGQTGKDSRHSATEITKVAAAAAAAIQHPQFASSLTLAIANKEKSPEIAYNDATHIIASMQQVAAAKTAAIAAMQSSHLRSQLKEDGGDSPRSIKFMPSSSFCHPASAPWSFQNHASF